MKLRFLAALLALPLFPAALSAWDYEGHRIVNQIALASLPKDFPAFVTEPAAAERIAFLAGEPDRWRNAPDLPIKHYNGLDHYCDLEQIPEAGLDFAKLPSLRMEFAVQFAAGRAAHPEHFPAIDQARNADHTSEWPGFAPWAIAEYYGKLRSAFSYLKEFEASGGTPEEIANARANVLYLMGIMGHYVGDCAQPLHTTKHHNGWVGENPNGYTQAKNTHSWFDGGYIAKAAIKSSDLTPRVTPAAPIGLAARPDGRDPMFVAVLDYLIAQNQTVEPLYQMEKAGKFSREKEQAIVPEGRAFIEGQLLKGGQMLGAIWLTAWKNTVPDTYLRTSLLKRQGGAPGTAAPKSAAP